MGDDPWPRRPSWPGAPLGPAIERVRDGTPVSHSLHLALELDARELGDVPGIADTFFSDGRALPEGATFRQPALARTLTQLATDGVAAFYGGEIGDRFARGLQALGSSLGRADLTTRSTTVAEPLTGGYRGWEILTTPPNSQGFVLLEMLAALEGDVTRFDPVRESVLTSGESAVHSRQPVMIPAMITPRSLAPNRRHERPIELFSPPG